MYEELEYEFEEFKRDFTNRNFVFGKYFDEIEYEDDYSHNEIHEYQSKFIDKVKDYLHKNAPNKYIITCSYCVFIMSVDEARRRNITKIDLKIVR